jgi:hypothetical protein
VHYTYLCGRIRENRAYGFRETVEVVGTGDKNILYSSCLDIRQYAHPEGTAFTLSYPHTKDLLETILLEPYAQIDGLIDYLAVVPNLEHNAVHPYNEVYRVKRTILPLQSSLIDLVGNDGYGRGRKVYLVYLAHLLLDVRYTHSFGVEGDDEALDGKATTLMFRNHDGLELTFAVTGNGNNRLAMRGLDLLRIRAIT